MSCFSKKKSASQVRFVVATARLAKIRLRRKGQVSTAMYQSRNQPELNVSIRPIYTVLGIEMIIFKVLKFLRLCNDATN